MCGIAGIFSILPHDPSIMDSMVHVLKRRGPDSIGKYANTPCTISLGHTRLSIIDLSNRANQPFFSASGRYAIVYNGEIYNFTSLRNELLRDHGRTFRTNSDTEVILTAFEVWGPDMAKRLDGMFALGIMDLEKHTLFLLRDRMGKKPLFYAQSNSCIAFASELKSLLKIPLVFNNRQVNRSAISNFLHLGYIPEPQTIFQDIKKFPSATYALVTRELQMDFTAYWKPLPKEDVQIEQAEVKHSQRRLEELLDDAVKKRLVADVPVGAFLSGGTDSSLITAIAVRHSPAKLKTFSIGFKDGKFDETNFARRVASHLGTDHREYILDERQALDILPEYLNYFDEPFADPSAIPTMLVSEMARREVKVVLTGDGGDELFQGYGSYRWADRLDHWPWKFAGHALAKIMERTGSSRIQRVAHLVDPAQIGASQSHIFSQEQYFFAQHEVRDLLNKQKSIEFVPFNHSGQQGQPWLSAGERQALFDLQYYLKDDLLVKVDRSSMYHGLECRCPLLDNAVVRFALSLPKSMKRKRGVDKWLLKEILATHLPYDMVFRPKHGFSVPLSSWLKADLRFLVDDHLSPAALDETDLFNRDKVTELIRDFFRGRDYLYQRLWVLILIQRWLKHNSS